MAKEKSDRAEDHLIGLSAATMGRLNNGRAELAINAGIAQILNDLEDRGRDGKPRKLTIVISVENVDNTNDILIDLQTKVTMPQMQSGSTRARLKSKGRGFVAEWSKEDPTNPDQPGIFDDEE